MLRNNLLKVAILAAMFVALIALPILAQTSITPAPGTPTAANLLDGKIFKGKLTLKTTVPVDPTTSSQYPATITETLTFMDGKMMSEAFKVKGYAFCPYTAVKDLKGITFTSKCEKIDDPSSVMLWTGKIVASALTGTISIKKSDKVLAEYAINTTLTEGTVPTTPAKVQLLGTFGQTKDGCYFVATEKENVALQFPKGVLSEKIGAKITVNGVWSTTTAMHCGMSKELIVESYSFSGDIATPTGQ